MNVRLTPYSEQLLREYLARGIYHSPEEVIEHALESFGGNAQPAAATERPRASLQEFRAFLDDLAEGSEKIPPTASSAFSRASIYQDHP